MNHPKLAPVSLAAAAAIATTLCTTASAQSLYSTDFASLDGWTVQTTCTPGYEWAADATPFTRACGAPAFRSPPASLNFNNGVDIGGPGFHGGAAVTCGSVTSPPIDLASAGADSILTFWVSLEMEIGCQWDALRLIVRPAGGGGEYYNACLNVQLSTDCDWQRFDFPLQAAWGDVEITFDFHALDDWVNDGSGPFIDDLSIEVPTCGNWSKHCEGVASTATGTNAVLIVTGSTSIASNEFGLAGIDFPNNTFAAAFYGALPDALVVGDGIRCIAAASSYRLSIAPTRDFGRPEWPVDLTAPPMPSGQVMAGSTWYYQAIYRDGPSFQFSDAIRVTFCE
ncbi:MAG: hypothetical protein AAF726_17270 [Planctomycetota bacterium]